MLYCQQYIPVLARVPMRPHSLPAYGLLDGLQCPSAKGNKSLMRLNQNSLPYILGAECQ